MPTPEKTSLGFRKSSYSGGRTQDCVEVADTATGAVVRDSKRPDAGYLAFSAQEWATFLAEVRTGRL